MPVLSGPKFSRAAMSFIDSGDATEVTAVSLSSCPTTGLMSRTAASRSLSLGGVCDMTGYLSAESQAALFTVDTEESCLFQPFKHHSNRRHQRFDSAQDRAALRPEEPAPDPAQPTRNNLPAAQGPAGGAAAAESEEDEDEEDEGDMSDGEFEQRVESLTTTLRQNPPTSWRAAVEAQQILFEKFTKVFSSNPKFTRSRARMFVQDPNPGTADGNLRFGVEILEAQGVTRGVWRAEAIRGSRVGNAINEILTNNRFSTWECAVRPNIQLAQTHSTVRLTASRAAHKISFEVPWQVVVAGDFVIVGYMYAGTPGS